MSFANFIILQDHWKTDGTPRHSAPASASTEAPSLVSLEEAQDRRETLRQEDREAMERIVYEEDFACFVVEQTQLRSAQMEAAQARLDAALAAAEAKHVEAMQEAQDLHWAQMEAKVSEMTNKLGKEHQATLVASALRRGITCREVPGRSG